MSYSKENPRRSGRKRCHPNLENHSNAMTKRRRGNEITAKPNDNDYTEKELTLVDLPQELLLHILSFLPYSTLRNSVMGTCSRLRTLAFDPSIYDQMLITKTPYGCFAQTKTWHHHDDNLTLEVVKGAKYMTKLVVHLDSWQDMKTLVQEALEHCKKLRHLEIDYIMGSHTESGSVELCRNIEKKGKYLRKLILNNSVIRPKDLNLMPQCLAGLRTLELDWTEVETLCEIANNCSQLNELSISSMSWNVPTADLLFGSLRKNLTHLRLSVQVS